MHVQTDTARIDRSVVERYSSRRQEPAWMAGRRIDALERFEATDWPKWDRTDISAIDFGAYLAALRRAMEVAPPPAPPVELQGRPLSQARSALGVERLPVPVAEALEEAEEQGAVLAHLLPSDPSEPVRTVRRISHDWQRRGIRLLSMAEALAEMPELVQRHFMTAALTAAQGKFQAWQGFGWDAGTLLWVPQGVQLEDRPVHVVYWADPGRLLTLPHTLIVTGPESRLQLVESWVSPDAAPEAPGTPEANGTPYAGLAPLVVGGVEIAAGAASRIDYVSLQTMGRHVLGFVHRQAVTERDAQVEWVLGEFGCRLTRGEFATSLQAPGSRSHSVLVFFGDGDQHLDLRNDMEHRGTHSESDIVARGVLAGSARGVYRAVSHIYRGAREASSYQRGNILVLSKAARADANPSVLVEESEVRQAGHAATVGQVDREQLFYLMSRGLPEKVATRLIVEGFLQPVLDRIPLEAIRSRIRKLVAAKLEGV
ncbi:SufD family Fe-S cluster assembly protein [Carboxydochorda subterranea]|uniref:SufD family Fe-S cluster assembly protein n=1 Tax=Carboxydichorda subterranea TaxID=3109565 RepID=A0ABZ1C1J3_9FIRM|nr:SufD family Fe-S cluster assembly protein [Limnochorda sp. L945t]WRP18636.1 SufD family Fe-S cluster assembly protein [Limnochorda sp. L945t]